ncbi:VQ motif-containing protein 4-like [Canna indica]|uniref:VQ motif-containing protein 4-like n=1 Tax=Canna indica TaxID=4628 RepID=A0AAQ3K4V2_9LILI|nr:VQ motif-containing protein 4-like [Canna indica]
MELSPKPQEGSTVSSSSNHSSATAPTQTSTSSLPLPTRPPLAPSVSCEANSCVTTFVQADSSSFKQVVQMLTGSAETAAAAAAATNLTSQKSPIPPAAKATGPNKPAFKLYERRNSLKNLKMISPLIPSVLDSNPNSPAGAFSPRKLPEILSPSTLDFPSLSLSPVTPLISDPFERPTLLPGSDAAKRAEDRAIAEKGFYLHPSPRAGRGDGQPPRLLPLFPVISPRAAANSSSATSN